MKRCFIFLSMFLCFLVQESSSMETRIIELNKQIPSWGLGEVTAVKEPIEIVIKKQNLDHAANLKLASVFSSEGRAFDIITLRIEGCRLGDTFGFSFLAGIPIHRLVIINSGLRSECLSGLFEYLSPQKLESLILSGNILSDNEDMLFESMCDACAHKFALEHLDLQDNGLSEDITGKIKTDPDISVISTLKL